MHRAERVWKDGCDTPGCHVQVRNGVEETVRTAMHQVEALKMQLHTANQVLAANADSAAQQKSESEERLQQSSCQEADLQEQLRSLRERLARCERSCPADAFAIWLHELHSPLTFNIATDRDSVVEHQ